MKLLWIAFYLVITSFSYGQDVSEFFTSLEAEVEFVGLDFSQVKMVGLSTRNTSDEVQGDCFRAWNDLLLQERRKYDVKRAFMKRKIFYNFDMLNRLNKKIKPLEIQTDLSPQSFSTKKLQLLVDRYDTNEMKSKYGLSFVVHSLNQFRERAYIYVVVFDVATKKILFSAQTSGDAGGFGFRNYWARTVYNILGNIRDYKFRTWKVAIEKQALVKKLSPKDQRK
ncbi:MAG: Unknown protein [uncultured Aureispira sp.]|uniref:Uncharacterized protein n=1 Tax=uncultured Aureispira sp. TaxID=1331704 RepID=A0A6S6SRP0_9BACT|nr:MAG: Unknown protein [uncultured Aureispira sp.]